MSFGIPVRNGLSIGLLASTFLTSGSGRLVPRLTLNFLTGAPLDSRITFTRSTTATFVGSDGLIQSSAINAPRFDYNPATLAPRGLLIEEQRVNLVLYSEQFDNAGWTKSSASVTADATTSPDGTANADRLTADGLLNTHVAQQTVTYTAAAHTLTVYAKRDTNDFVQLRFGAAAIALGNGFANFDLNAGTVGTIGTGLTAASITPAGNGWYRCTITGTTLAATSNLGIYIVTSATAVSAEPNTLTTSVFLYGAQLEAGSFATSYIPTVASTVTRAADIASMTGTNFSSWYNQSEGTVVAQASTQRTTGTAVRVLGIDDGTTDNRHSLSFDGTSPSTTFNAVTIVGAVAQASFALPVTPLAVSKLAYAYKANDFAASANGGAVSTDTSGTVPSGLIAMRIGSLVGGIQQLNGHLSSITYYATRLSNAQLQALSA